MSKPNPGESFEDYKIRRAYEDSQKNQPLKNENETKPKNKTESKIEIDSKNKTESKPVVPADMQKKLDALEKAGYIPRYGSKPLHVGLMRRFGNGIPVVLQWIDLPLRAERAQYRNEKEYVIDGKSAIFHDHKSGKSFLLYDMDLNLPLIGAYESRKCNQCNSTDLTIEFLNQPNTASADLQAIYGVKESFRQFIAGIRNEINRNVRQTVVLAIVFMVSGFILGHFL